MPENRLDDLIPPLRRDLRLEEVEEQGLKVYRLVDTLLSRKIRLDRRGSVIARLLDRPQRLQELYQRLQATGKPMDFDVLRRVVDAFTGLGLLETENIESENATADFLNAPLLIPQDLRFSCTGCGSCCHGVNVGPVTEEVAENIRTHIAELQPAALSGKSPFYCMVPEGETTEVLICQTRNGACVFLDPDGLCRIHRTLGAKAKPLICRLFPFRFVQTPEGIVVSLQTECRDILRASLGEVVMAQEEELRALLAKLETIPKARPFVAIDGQQTAPFSEYLRLKDCIISAASGKAKEGAWAMIVAVNDTIAQKARMVRDLPGSDLKSPFYCMLRDVGQSLMRLKDQCRYEHDALRFHTTNLDLVIEALKEVPLFMTQVLSDEQGEAARFAHLLVANFWHGCDEVLGPPDLVTAASQFAFAWFLCRAVAIFRARQVHRLFLTPQDLVDAWVLCHMLLRNHRVEKAIRKHRPALALLFFKHLRALLERRLELEQASMETDFFVF